jgi:Domain of unknown function (DUF4158)
MMKRNWGAEELIEHFILLPEERALLIRHPTHAMDYNQLGFAVLLKFFQLEARFPTHKNEVPKVVVSFIAEQLQFCYADYLQYRWQGRTFKFHRAQIREFLGFRPATRHDKELLKSWLLDSAIPSGMDFESLKTQAHQWLRQSKIEPPVPAQIERLLRSAICCFDTQFCHSTFNQLSAS